MADILKLNGQGVIIDQNIVAKCIKILMVTNPNIDPDLFDYVWSEIRIAITRGHFIDMYGASLDESVDKKSGYLPSSLVMKVTREVFDCVHLYDVIFYCVKHNVLELLIAYVKQYVSFVFYIIF